MAFIWDVETRKQLAVLRGHSGPVLRAAFSPDGQLVITASEDKTARLWNVETGKEITRRPWLWRLWYAVTDEDVPSPLQHEDVVKSAEFSPDGRRVLTVSGSRVQLWEAATGKKLTLITAYGARLLSAAFSPDGRRVVTTSFDATARLWDAETGKVLAVIARHGNWVSSAAFSPDGRELDEAIAFQTRWRRIMSVSYTSMSALAIISSGAAAVVAALGHATEAAILAAISTISLGTEKALMLREKWLHHLVTTAQLDSLRAGHHI